MKFDWADIDLFLALAEAGGLARTAQVTGKSQATLGRHMARLERDLGKRLFQRGAAGYALTGDGRALLEMARDMRRDAQAIRGWANAPGGPQRLRITAGTWTTAWLCAQLPRVRAADALWMPEFLSTAEPLDIARRVADIGIRNARPEQGWLAGRRTRRVHFAAYGTPDAPTGWITVAGLNSASMRWMRADPDARVITQANTPHAAVALAQAGLGRVVLPVFTETLGLGLVALSAPIAALESDEWLVCHHDARHDPPVRAALEAIGAALTGD